MTTPADIAEFIAFWRDSTLKERSGSQGHFIALCGVLGIKSPTEADPHGDWFAFEKGAKKTGGGDGWADVWRRHCFAWEYKGKHKDLQAALRQLQQYALALENPQLLIVSDMETIEINTNFPNTDAFGSASSSYSHSRFTTINRSGKFRFRLKHNSGTRSVSLAERGHL